MDSIRPRNRRILIVEDEFFIADDVAGAVRAGGGEVIGPASTIAEAFRLLKSDPPDAAILDVNLGGDMIFAFADALKSRKIPFLFNTGYDAATIPPRHRDVPLCEKPIAVKDVVSLIPAAA